MRSLRRLLLGIATMAAPVFVAACYGPPAFYSLRGRVVDPSTKAGIGNIQVACGADTAVTKPDGSFEVQTRRVCDAYVLTDTAGAHQTTTVPFENDRDFAMPPASAPAPQP